MLYGVEPVSYLIDSSRYVKGKTPQTRKVDQIRTGRTRHLVGLRRKIKISRPHSDGPDLSAIALLESPSVVAFCIVHILDMSQKKYGDREPP